jgi:hypothetical protein
MTVDQIFEYILVVITSAAIVLFSIKRLGLQRATLVLALTELTECIGAALIFLAMNVVVGASVVLVLRGLGFFVALYVLGSWSLVLFSFTQGFLFHLWWRRSGDGKSRN